MSIKRHLFPIVGSLVLIADVPPLPRPGPNPAPPSSPGCTMQKAAKTALAAAAEKPSKA